MAVTTAAVVGIAATAATTGMSFAQAGKQKKAMRQAERDAEEAMQAARKKLEVNVFDQLSIQKEPFELEREALLSQGAQAIQAGVESERGAAATAGRVQMAQQEGQGAVRTAMGQELQGLERLSAQEEGRLRDIGVQLDLEEVAGAQLAAANAQELQAQAMQQGMEGVVSLAGQVASTAPLFQRNRAAEKAAIGNMAFSTEQFQQFGNVAEKGGLGAAGTDGFTNLDFSAVSGMSNQQYNKFLKALTPQQRMMLFTNPQFAKASELINPTAARLIR
jgi:type II secretory pathway pseudopilin PulG